MYTDRAGDDVKLTCLFAYLLPVGQAAGCAL